MISNILLNRIYKIILHINTQNFDFVNYKNENDKHNYVICNYIHTREQLYTMSSRPPSCFTCGKIVPWEKFFKIKEEHPTEKESTWCDMLRLRRYCCRRMILSHPDEFERVNKKYILAAGDSDIDD